MAQLKFYVLRATAKLSNNKTSKFLEIFQRKIPTQRTIYYLYDDKLIRTRFCGTICYNKIIPDYIIALNTLIWKTKKKKQELNYKT